VPIEELRIKPDYPNLIAAIEQAELKSVLQEVRDEAAKAGVMQQSELML
jgi:cytochrome c553